MPFRRLPSMMSLRAFESVARHGSFKAAADELSVTPGALSQQVKKLEDDLEIPLLVRQHRAIVPTDAGLRLQTGLTDAFLTIRESVEAVRPVTDSNTIVFACPPPFASKWLIPRLTELMEVQPDIDLRINASYKLIDYAQDNIDVGVRLGTCSDHRLDEGERIEESFLPLASPKFIEEQQLRESRDLLRVPLLSMSSSKIFPNIPTWEKWFEVVGLPPGNAARGVDFGNQIEHALDAALTGAGVVLGPRVLASADIAKGRLVNPFGPELPMKANYAVVHRKDRMPKKLHAFTEWLTGALQTSSTLVDEPATEYKARQYA